MVITKAKSRKELNAIYNRAVNENASKMSNWDAQQVAAKVIYDILKDQGHEMNKAKYLSEHGRV